MDFVAEGVRPGGRPKQHGRKQWMRSLKLSKKDALVHSNGDD